MEQALTLRQIQLTATSELRAIAKASTNRAYAVACSQMANAQDAHTLGNKAMRDAHIEKAKEAYALFTADMSAQESDAARKIAEFRKAGLEQPGLTSAGGKLVSKIVAERGVSTWANDWIAR